MDQLFFTSVFILPALLVSIECATFYISPSTSDTSCTSVNSCMTLSQIASSSSVTRSGSNLTIILMPGNHTLNISNFTVTGIHYFSMKSSDEYSKHMINCI